MSITSLTIKIPGFCPVIDGHKVTQTFCTAKTICSSRVLPKAWLGLALSGLFPHTGQGWSKATTQCIPEKVWIYLGICELFITWMSSVQRSFPLVSPWLQPSGSWVFWGCWGSLSCFQLAQVKPGSSLIPLLEEQNLALQRSGLLSCRVQHKQKEGPSPEENILQMELKLGSGPGSALADIWIWCTAAMHLWISSIIAVNNSRNSEWC